MIVQLTDEVLFIGSDWPDIVKKGRFLYIFFFFGPWSTQVFIAIRSVPKFCHMSFLPTSHMSHLF